MNFITKLEFFTEIIYIKKKTILINFITKLEFFIEINYIKFFLPHIHKKGQKNLLFDGNL